MPAWGQILSEPSSRQTVRVVLIAGTDILDFAGLIEGVDFPASADPDALPPTADELAMVAQGEADDALAEKYGDRIEDYV